MIRSYLKTALRNLKRNKSYTLINVLGLAVGMAACFLIFLVIQFETSFDNFHKKKSNIYRIGSIRNTQDGVSYTSGVSFPVASGLRIDYPQIKEVASIFKNDGDLVTIENPGSTELKKFQEDVFFAEPEFFSMFDFAWLSGDAKSTLTAPGNAVLTREMAEKYFGDWKSAIGKTIKRNNRDAEIYKVTGILENVPANTDFPLGIIFSYASLKNTNVDNNLTDWVSTWGNAYTFVVLPDNYPVAKLNKDLIAFAKRHKPVDYATDAYIAQPMTDIHFNDDFGNFKRHTFSRSLIKAISLIGIFLLVIACVNFINLATAQAVNRSKEVGVRKVMGSNRRQLTFQFLSETALITIASLVAAVLISITVLPLLNKLLALKMTTGLMLNPSTILFLIIITALVIILSGLYPAIILSGFNPITALKSKITSKMMGGISLRRGLVVFQFGISHILIIGTLIVVSQMNFFRNASLGVDKTAIINVGIPNDSASLTKIGVLRNELLKNPDIRNVSFSFSSPTTDGNWSSDFRYDNAVKSTNFQAILRWADTGYFKTYNIRFAAGRPYYPSDTVNEFVVNETLLKKLGVNDPKEAIGKKINFWDGEKTGYIVGVIKDFNAVSLKQPMSPVILSNWKDVYQNINIKIAPGSEKNTLSYVESVWNKAFPANVYQYKFFDESIAGFYRQERQLSQLYKIFAAIAIFISCLGLYGLVSFMAAQRTKEVGIRKVLGASAGNIIYLLSKEFSLLIMVAFVIAGPIAYLLMNKWLQNYTYRIHIGAMVFVLAILGSMIIAWITVGHRAVKAAIASPVRALRSE
jgi:putative ABC transport system permease protein